MGNDPQDPTLSRRGFLKSAIATAAVATAAGSGAAVLLGQRSAATAITSLPAAPVMMPLAQNAAVVANAGGGSLAQLAAAQAENMQLRAALDAAERRLAAYEGTLGQNDAAVQVLQGHLGEANNRVNILAGLVALYEQLDAVNVDEVVAGGLAAVEGVLTGLAGRVPDVTAGIEAGWQALAELEAQIPLMDSGRRWLNSHVDRLQGFHQIVENVVRDAVEAAGSFVDNLSQWFQDVLRWLPFGMGNKAARIMQALTNLLNETPATIAGLRTNVSQPLGVWLEGEGEAMPIRRRLVKPLREQALQPAAEAIGQVAAVQATYQNQLAAPLQNASGHRQQIRALIQAYRQQHPL